MSPVEMKGHPPEFQRAALVEVNKCSLLLNKEAYKNGKKKNNKKASREYGIMHSRYRSLDYHNANM